MKESVQHQGQTVISPAITATDRLSLTLSMAILMHALFILGITFTNEDKAQIKSPTIEVTLVQQRSKPPETADILAQTNLEGGGDVAEDVHPSTLLPAPFPAAQPELVTPPAKKERETEAVRALPEPTQKKMSEKTMLTANEETKEKQINKKNKVDTHKNSAAVERHAPSTAALLNNSFKIAALNAKIRRKMESRAKRPRRKFISANVKEYDYAAYEESWRLKIERIGNLNYPETIRRENISGSLVLDVALNADGSVHDIAVRRSSGKKILDTAAIKIVRLAAPFSPFPEHIRKETDILHITRTWQFTDKYSLK